MLREFSSTSGLLVNFNKSGILLSVNAKEEDYAYVCSVLDVSKINVSSKYLGLPFSFGKAKCKALNFILDRIRGKLVGWKQKFISQAVEKF